MYVNFLYNQQLSFLVFITNSIINEININFIAFMYSNFLKFKYLKNFQPIE